MTRYVKEIGTILADNIAARRKASGFTQMHFAELLGISVESLSRIENGGISPRISRVALMADLLGCSVAELFMSPEEKLRQLAAPVDNAQDMAVALQTLADQLHLLAQIAARNN